MNNRRIVGVYFTNFVPPRESRFPDVIYQDSVREDPAVMQVCTKTMDAR